MKVDGGSEHGSKDGLEGGNSFVEVEGKEFEGASIAKGEELFGDGVGARGGTGDMVEGSADIGIWGGAGDFDIGVALDDGEEIFKFVSDAGCKMADCFHLMSVALKL